MSAPLSISPTEAADALVALSQWVDRGMGPRNQEAMLWGRVAKVGEEFGEAIQALVGYTGQNPRKGYANTVDDVVEELLDTAVAALAAVEHIRQHDGRAIPELFDKILRVRLRAIGVRR